MKTRTISSFILFPILCLSCSKIDKENSDMEIAFSATSYSITTIDAKADQGTGNTYLYENLSDIQNKDKHGGYFNVKAYIHDHPDEHFTSATTVKYHTDTQQEPAWYIFNPSTNAFESRYWPKTYALDFLAFMPLQRPAAGSTQEITQSIDPDAHISSAFSYDATEKSPVFSCVNLPLTKTGQASAKEFMYAWAPGQSYTSVNTGADATGKVKLEFKHAMAAVYIKIAGAHGGTILQEIGFKGIYNNGSFTVTDEEWTPSGSRTDLIIDTEDQKIPDDVQIGHTYGPYLVMPQNHGNEVNLYIDYDWREQTAPVSKPLGAEWECGKKYTYSLVLGDSAEDIMVNVSVEPWGDPIGGDHEIEVK